MVDKPISPLLRWAGSKRQLLPRIASYWSTNLGVRLTDKGFRRIIAHF